MEVLLALGRKNFPFQITIVYRIFAVYRIYQRLPATFFRPQMDIRVNASLYFTLRMT